MPHDPMHVLLEGLTGYAMALLLQVCLTDKIFCLEWLNTKLQAFSYSYLDRDNKPEKLNKKQVFESISIKQTAAAQLTLCYVLLFILSQEISVNNAYYKNYMH